MLILTLHPLLVLIGIQIAGVGVDGFEQSVDSAQSDALHVGFFHVVALDAREHFGINGQMAVGVLWRGALAAHGSKEEHKNETGGGGGDEQFDTAGHNEWAWRPSSSSIAWVWEEGWWLRRARPGRGWLGRVGSDRQKNLGGISQRRRRRS